MQVVFRVDAGQHIGLGHLMRCLTLADGLKAQGADCVFLMRAHDGHKMELVEKRGYRSCLFPKGVLMPLSEPADYQKWLGVTWEEDLRETLAALEELPRSDLLVVDHYALDIKWETGCAPHVGRILVIDDLANRKHAADMLLDQNFGRREIDYHGLVSPECDLFLGTDYALLRPEFRSLRDATLARRQDIAIPRTLLVSLGSVPNAVLLNIMSYVASIIADLPITTIIVVGSEEGTKNKIKDLFKPYSVKLDIFGHISDMARLMSQADIAIGGSGAATWERCCLGLPTFSIILANNQEFTARALLDAKVLIGICSLNNLETKDVRTLFTICGSRYKSVVLKMSSICDGAGLERLIEEILCHKSLSRSITI